VAYAEKAWRGASGGGMKTYPGEKLGNLRQLGGRRRENGRMAIVMASSAATENKRKSGEESSAAITRHLSANQENEINGENEMNAGGGEKREIIIPASVKMRNGVCGAAAMGANALGE